MDADSVGKHSQMEVLFANMNAFIQVFQRNFQPIKKTWLDTYWIFVFYDKCAGEKPYACPVCPRAFNQRVVLREHIRSHHSQPDPNYEDSLMPYYCTVCGNLFKTPDEIIQHLIGHSDANTVSNRQPVVCFIFTVFFFQFRKIFKFFNFHET